MHPAARCTLPAILRWFPAWAPIAVGCEAGTPPVPYILDDSAVAIRHVARPEAAPESPPGPGPTPRSVAPLRGPLAPIDPFDAACGRSVQYQVPVARNEAQASSVDAFGAVGDGQHRDDPAIAQAILAAGPGAGRASDAGGRQHDSCRA